MSVSKVEVVKALGEVRAKKEDKNFKQSIDIIVNLKDLDLRNPTNRVNLNVLLPHGTGKERRVCIFATGDLALRASRAGVDLVIGNDRLRELATNRKEAKKLLNRYDIFLAEASLMPLVGRVAGPILGPKGKMPIPLPPNIDIENVIERQKRVVLLRSRDKPLVQRIVGVEDMDDEKIAENIETLLSNLIESLRKGINNIRSIYLKTTMGNPIKVSE